MDETTTKLTKLLGVYNDVKVKPKGVRSVWFYLSPEKAKDSTLEWNSVVLKNNFNTALTKDLECSVILGPRLKNKKQIPANITTPVSNQPSLIAEVQAKYKTLWDAGHTFFTSEDDPYLHVLSMYVLRSTDVPYEIVGVEETVSTTYRPTSRGMDGVPKTDQVPAWRVRIRIPKYTFTSSTDIITLLASEGTVEDPVAAIQQIRERVTTAALTPTAEDGSDEGKPDVVYEALPVTTSDFWYSDEGSGTIYSGRKRYLKTSILTNPSLNTSEKLSYILGCLDTGYLKKKAKWYEVIIAIAIIIIAFKLGGPQGAKVAATLIGASQAVVAVVTIAVTLTVAALYISLAALAASLMGAQNVSLSLTQFLRAIEPLTRIAAVIAFIVSIYGVVKEAAKKLTEETAKQGAKSALAEAATGIAKNIVESMTGLTKLSNMTMSHIVKMLSFTFDVYKDWYNRDLQRELNNYRKDIAALTESDEKAKTSDVVKELMSSYPNPLSNDWSYYTELYDRPYEWWATPFHTGNIQATTVNALWLNEPQNAILYNNSTGDS
jgi:hypothetical protein